MSAVVADTNWLVAVIDGKDKWHERACQILRALEAHQAQIIYLDCVLNETISVLARRAEEQKRADEFAALLEDVRRRVPDNYIIWVSLETRRLYSQIVDLVQQTHGVLNFHDALIALFCKEWDIELLVSFDEDFDRLSWLKRVGDSGTAPSQLGSIHLISTTVG